MKTNNCILITTCLIGAILASLATLAFTQPKTKNTTTTYYFSFCYTTKDKQIGFAHGTFPCPYDSINNKLIESVANTVLKQNTNFFNVEIVTMIKLDN